MVKYLDCGVLLLYFQYMIILDYRSGQAYFPSFTRHLKRGADGSLERPRASFLRGTAALFIFPKSVIFSLLGKVVNTPQGLIRRSEETPNLPSAVYGWALPARAILIGKSL